MLANSGRYWPILAHTGPILPRLTPELPIPPGQTDTTANTGPYRAIPARTAPTNPGLNPPSLVRLPILGHTGQYWPILGNTGQTWLASSFLLHDSRGVANPVVFGAVVLVFYLNPICHSPQSYWMFFIAHIAMLAWGFQTRSAEINRRKRDK